MKPKPFFLTIPVVPGESKKQASLGVEPLYERARNGPADGQWLSLVGNGSGSDFHDVSTPGQVWKPVLHLIAADKPVRFRVSNHLRIWRC